MDKLCVRIYSVRFGDAILITVPDRGSNGKTEIRHILIDVGNVLGDKGGEDSVFQPIVEDVLTVLGGKPLDLYIMTHEHMDHTQGLPYADKYVYPGEDLNEKLQTRCAWLTASAAEDYYEKHEKARQALTALEDTYAAIEGFLGASPESVPRRIETLMLNNSPYKTKDNVAYLRKLVKNPIYVHRAFDPKGSHPFHEANFKIWAPEEDTAVYYGRFRPMALGVTPPAPGRRTPTLTEVTPPRGVDAGAFYNLLRQRQGYAENLMEIDKARNNTSVVFCLEWRGWRLLFTGDAEDRSWREMDKAGVLKPVHFFKASHHGSHTGLPRPELLDKILPGVSKQSPQPESKPRHAVVSTYPDTYTNVPDEDTLGELGARCEIHSTLGLKDGGHIDLVFEGGTREVTVQKKG